MKYLVVFVLLNVVVFGKSEVVDKIILNDGKVFTGTIKEILKDELLLDANNKQTSLKIKDIKSIKYKEQKTDSANSTNSHQLILLSRNILYGTLVSIDKENVIFKINDANFSIKKENVSSLILTQSKKKISADNNILLTNNDVMNYQNISFNRGKFTFLTQEGELNVKSRKVLKVNFSNKYINSKGDIFVLLKNKSYFSITGMQQKGDILSFKSNYGKDITISKENIKLIVRNNISKVSLDDALSWLKSLGQKDLTTGKKRFADYTLEKCLLTKNVNFFNLDIVDRSSCNGRTTIVPFLAKHFKYINALFPLLEEISIPDSGTLTLPFLRKYYGPVNLNVFKGFYGSSPDLNHVYTKNRRSSVSMVSKDVIDFLPNFKLKSMYLSIYKVQGNMLLSLGEIPSLMNLSLYLNIVENKVDFSFLSKLKSLTGFSCNNPLDNNQIKYLNNLPIKSLDLKFYKNFNKLKLPELNNLKLSLESKRPVLGNLSKVCPKLTHLTIKGKIHGLVLPNILSLKKLTNLSLEGVSVSEVGENSMKHFKDAINLTKLTIKGYASSDGWEAFSNIKFPNLKYLYVYPYKAKHMTNDALKSFNREQFPSLSYLKFVNMKETGIDYLRLAEQLPECKID